MGCQIDNSKHPLGRRDGSLEEAMNLTQAPQRLNGLDCVQTEREQSSRSLFAGRNLVGPIPGHGNQRARGDSPYRCRHRGHPELASKNLPSVERVLLDKSAMFGLFGGESLDRSQAGKLLAEGRAEMPDLALRIAAPPSDIAPAVTKNGCNRRTDCQHYHREPPIEP